jgi:biopolymer transport protein ExbB
LLNAFEAIQASEHFSAGLVGVPLAKALLSTAAGLTLAIPCHIGYTYLMMRVDALTGDMEKAASELTVFFERIDNQEDKA